MASSDDMEVNGFAEYRSGAELAAVELFKGYPDSLLQFAYVFCVIFMLIGIPGNLITIIALMNCKKFRNATAIFIINLQICNLIFCCMVLPMTAVTFSTKHWIFGKAMCGVYPYMKFALNGTAHFTVVAITINRCIIVCHPYMYTRLYNKKIIALSLISTWVAAFSLFLPTLFGVWGRYDLEPTGGNCTMLPDRNNINPKKFFLILAFVGPYLIIIICYSRIWCTVRKTAKKRNVHNARAMQPTMSSSDSDPSVTEKGPVCLEPTAYESSTDDDTNKLNSPICLTPNGRDSALVTFFKTSFRVTKKENRLNLPSSKDKKLATMIVAILVSFTLCHLPIMVTRVVYGEYKSDPVANILAHLLDYSSAFISPIIYVIMSSEYRQAYTSLFKDLKSKIMEYFER